MFNLNFKEGPHTYIARYFSRIPSSSGRETYPGRYHYMDCLFGYGENFSPFLYFTDKGFPGDDNPDEKCSTGDISNILEGNLGDHDGMSDVVLTSFSLCR